MLAVFIFVPEIADVLGGSSPPPLGWLLAAAAIPTVLAADTLDTYVRSLRGRAAGRDRT